ncbi:MAG: hypothetical protein MUO97_05720 [Dehalococcoidia bacterium]|nr:hypothetical protein [Dehalococcoidia bacterium]
MNRTLGPRDVGGILKETFTIYKNNFLRFAAIFAIVEVPLVIISFVLGVSRGFMGQGINDLPFSNAGATIKFIFFILMSFIATTLMNGALIHAISEQYLKRPVDIGRAYSFAGRRLGAMLGAYFLVMLAVLGLSITIIGIPAAIYFGIIWAFILQTVLLEGCGPGTALSHSSALAKNNWWRVFGIVLLLGLIVASIFYIFNLPTIIWTFRSAFTSTPMSTSLIIWQAILQAIGVIIAIPIGVTGATLLYFDLRVRKQGYNLDALANELGLANTTTDAVPSPPE